jgi:hypothetical protein
MQLILRLQMTKMFLMVSALHIFVNKTESRTFTVLKYNTNLFVRPRVFNLCEELASRSNCRNC